MVGPRCSGYFGGCADVQILLDSEQSFISWTSLMSSALRFRNIISTVLLSRICNGTRARSINC